MPLRDTQSYLDGSLPPTRRRTSEDHSPGSVQDTIEHREAASTFEPLEIVLDGSLPPKDYLPGNVQDHEAASTSELLEVDIDESLPPSKYTYIYFFNLNLMNKVKISIRRGNVIPDET